MKTKPVWNSSSNDLIAIQYGEMRILLQGDSAKTLATCIGIGIGFAIVSKMLAE
ncbi:MAG: hypothetical protein AAF599_05360 [Bacteroidota bacterium]